jgi:hypothetical protein
MVRESRDQACPAGSLPGRVSRRASGRRWVLRCHGLGLGLGLGSGLRGLEGALTVEFDEHRSAASGTLLVGGEADLALEVLARPGQAVKNALRRAMPGLHQDPGGPLLATVIILPRVDRAAADRRLVKGDLEQLEPAMSANHGSTLAGWRTRTRNRGRSGLRGRAERWSGRRGSNPRHSAWEADTLPTELLPLGRSRSLAGVPDRFNAASGGVL